MLKYYFIVYSSIVLFTERDIKYKEVSVLILVLALMLKTCHLLFKIFLFYVVTTLI